MKALKALIVGAAMSASVCAEQYPLESALDAVMNVPIYIGNYKEGTAEHTPHPEFMFFAHELQRVLPSAVHGEKDGPTYQWVEYQKLIPMLLGAVQELSQEVTRLREELKEMEKNSGIISELCCFPERVEG